MNYKRFQGQGARFQVLGLNFVFFLFLFNHIKLLTNSNNLIPGSWNLIPTPMNPKLPMLQNRLVKLNRHIGKQARRMGVSCYRLYDHDIPEFPFCIELYGDKLYVAEYQRRHGMTEEEHEAWLEESLILIGQTLEITPENIFLKLRRRKPGRLGQYQRLEQQKNEMDVEENGLKFIVNLSDYLDTGLFLDHRVTRQRVREESAGKHVLNLFAYTGSFSVYAAAGQAASVTTVDLSNTYIDWARRNMTLNGFTGNQFIFHQADVLQWLKNHDKETYDIIVLDPPTFSNSQRMKDILDIQRDHADLINDCLRLLKPGGQIYFSTNARQFQLETEKISSSGIKDITRATTPFDFEGRLFRWCFLVQG